MLGEKRVFNDIFSTSFKSSPRKGRSPHFHHLRNECLIARYFYKGKFELKRYDIILKELNDEFFISEGTIPDILDEYLQDLHDLKREDPGKKYFKDKWPHLVW